MKTEGSLICEVQCLIFLGDRAIIFEEQCIF